MAPNVGRGCFLCGSKEHDDCDMDLDELTSLSEKIGLSVDAFRAWIEEQKALDREELAQEREALREEAARKERAREAELTLERKMRERDERALGAELKLECERRERKERAREAELALAREVAALEERNRQLRLRLQEAQNATRARESVAANSVDCMYSGTSISEDLHEAETSFTSVRQNTRQSDIDSGASGRQDTVIGGAVVFLESSTIETILSCRNNGGERHEENPQGVNVDSPSWVPLDALKSGPAIAECHSAKSEVALPYSELVQRGAVTSHVDTAENHTENVPRYRGTSGDREYSDVSRREQEATNKITGKESARDSSESTRNMGAKNDFRCDGTGLMQGLVRCAVTDESPVRSCEQGTISPEKHVLQTCLSQQDAWVSDVFTHTLLHRIPCSERDPIQWQVQAEVVVRINEHKEVESACCLCRNADHGGDSTKVAQESFSYERTDKSYVLCGSETLSLEKDVLRTCLVQQGIWASHEFDHAFLGHTAHLEHLSVLCGDVQLRAVLSTSASAQFEWTMVMNIFSWSHERASLLPLCNKIVRGVRFVWDAIT